MELIASYTRTILKRFGHKWCHYCEDISCNGDGPCSTLLDVDPPLSVAAKCTANLSNPAPLGQRMNTHAYPRPQHKTARSTPWNFSRKRQSESECVALERMRVVYLLQASASVSNSSVQYSNARGREKETYTKVESRERKRVKSRPVEFDIGAIDGETININCALCEATRGARPGMGGVANDFPSFTVILAG
ncbi:hypothetical protein EVAR_89544_1 [Eumeta japonica]|uniref:Uncharacterized protein n=1 Tax=Eumeta variegata TaxID=151549 RepID=A0A4C1Z6V8_EUMVA|nr:hypothetical protein EVAR_89544_1 [Eumeta japonica]